MSSLAGTVAVVTGAGSGIGRATASLLAEQGSQVVAADINLTAAQETVATSSGDAIAAEVDVRDEASVQGLLDQAARSFGREAGVLANIAGIGSTTRATDTDLTTWEDVFAVNARGVFLCCKHAIPRMAASGGGSVVNMASVAGMIGLRNRAAYCASKGAVIALTRALAVDHVGERVRVNCICPGTVDSPWLQRLIEGAGESRADLVQRQPMGRLGTPEEIAKLVVYLASEDSAFMTGSAVVIDGGLTAG